MGEGAIDFLISTPYASANEEIAGGFRNREITRDLRASRAELAETCRSRGILRPKLFDFVLDEDLPPLVEAVD